MYAVMIAGGKQHRVQAGQSLKVETMDHAVGDTVSFEQVLLIQQGGQVQVGAPYLEGARVRATVLSHGRGPKVRIIKFKRRKHHMKRMGHRQGYTEVLVDAIEPHQAG